MSDKPESERISILEVRIDNSDKVIQQTQELIIKLIDKFDNHISDEIEHETNMQVTLSSVASAVAHLDTTLALTNSKLEKFSEISSSTNLKVVKAESALATIAKIFTIVSMLIAGVWTVYDFSATHPETIAKLFPRPK